MLMFVRAEAGSAEVQLDHWAGPSTAYSPFCRNKIPETPYLINNQVDKHLTSSHEKARCPVRVLLLTSAWFSSP